MQDSDDTRIASIVRDKIQESRTQLLDLGNRNRLIHTSFRRATGSLIPIVRENSETIFRLIWRERKSLSFLPGAPSRVSAKADDNSSTESVEVESGWIPDELRDLSEADRRSDRYLETTLTPEGLQSRLLAMYRDAHTLEGEQGVSILFLSLGFVRWFEHENSDIERLAPLVLIPVDLKRTDARTALRLIARDADLEENLSFRELLRREHTIELPTFPDGDEWTISEYFNSVAATIRHKTRVRTH